MSCKNTICDIKAQDNFHIVLIEPENSLNIGAVARAMMNLGFHNLHLVAPPDYQQNKALATACWASSIIEQANFHDSLEAALAPMEDVVGFTSRHGKYRPAQVFLPDWIEGLKDQKPRKTALVFGCERTGLRMEHIEHCRLLIRIPSTEENPVFNLAQAVLLTVYELSRLTWHDFADNLEQELPSWNEFYHLDRLVSEVLIHSGFYRKGSPEPIPGLVKNLMRRMNPDAREMRVLLGMFSRINRALDCQQEDEVDSSSEDLIEKVV